MSSKRRVHIPVRRGKDKVPERVPEQAPTDDAANDGPVRGSQGNPQAGIDWQDRALRLQAEMENFRKRQQRLTSESEVKTRARLLAQFLPVVDALEMAVAHLRPDDAYDQNIKVAYDELRRILSNAGVERIPAEGEPFDPHRHEAVAMVPASARQQEEMRVVEEERTGYRLGSRVLRPARVVVAKKQ